jgi:hypothetical protein
VGSSLDAGRIVHATTSAKKLAIEARVRASSILADCRRGVVARALATPHEPAAGFLCMMHKLISARWLLRSVPWRALRATAAPSTLCGSGRTRCGRYRWRGTASHCRSQDSARTWDWAASLDRPWAIRCQKSDVRSQKSDVRSQKSEVRWLLRNACFERRTRLRSEFYREIATGAWLVRRELAPSSAAAKPI